MNRRQEEALIREGHFRACTAMHSHEDTPLVVLYDEKLMRVCIGAQAGVDGRDGDGDDDKLMPRKIMPS